MGEREDGNFIWSLIKSCLFVVVVVANVEVGEGWEGRKES